MKKTVVMILLLLIMVSYALGQGQDHTIALWAFDEQNGVYPSCVLSDQSCNNYQLVLGPGGQIVNGKYGNALEPIEQSKIELPKSHSTVFGLVAQPVPEGRTVEPLTWFNSNFCALITSGENHLRKEFEYAQVTKTKLNLGEYDWTVEFWFMPNNKTENDGVVFEIGTGPRAENEKVTRLILNKDFSKFTLFNQSSNNMIDMATRINYEEWNHIAFAYEHKKQMLKHFSNGKLQSSVKDVVIKSLERGEEDYMSIGRDGTWYRPLQGKLDELRFSEGTLYKEDFKVPSSFSETVIRKAVTNLKKGLPLLFNREYGNDEVINIGSRKHLFIDDVLLSEYDSAEFVVNPPRKAECVIDNIKGSFRKHLNVVEDEAGLIRLYVGVENDYLAVWTSTDGVNWIAPDLRNGEYKNRTNIVVYESTAMGTVFIDPNGPAEERWKYLSGYNESGVFIYASPDGYNFRRIKTAVLPFWPGSQSNIFYDEQQQKYIAHHRADFAKGISGSTQREFVVTETKDVLSPWPFKPITQEEYWKLSKVKRIKETLPFYLDNGPLTPGGFGNDYPVSVGAVDGYDPIDTDIYVAKANKYAWAPDTYLAFPTVYFHYKNSQPVTRTALYSKRYKRGSGPLETQLAVSRDGKKWQRIGRPVYVGTGEHAGKKVNTAYMAIGMVRRGDEIWQYYFGESQYHSAYTNEPEGRGVYRVIQRVDGFVSLDSPYEKETYVITKPFVFEGNKLTLNIDTDAAGYAQVGFLDKNGNDIPGFSVDDCIYINGDFIETDVEWMKNREEIERIGNDNEEAAETISEKVITSADVSELEGKTVQLIFRMRGSKLYAMQFVE